MNRPFILSLLLLSSVFSAQAMQDDPMGSDSDGAAVASGSRATKTKVFIAGFKLDRGGLLLSPLQIKSRRLQVKERQLWESVQKLGKIHTYCPSKEIYVFDHPGSLDDPFPDSYNLVSDVINGPYIIITNATGLTIGNITINYSRGRKPGTLGHNDFEAPSTYATPVKAGNRVTAIVVSYTIDGKDGVTKFDFATLSPKSMVVRSRKLFHAVLYRDPKDDRNPIKLMNNMTSAYITYPVSG